MATETRETISLPKTHAAIKAEFPGRDNQGLRNKLWEAALTGETLGSIAGSVALTATGKASLEAVAATCQQEWTDRGYDRVHTGPDEDGVMVAYLDQPLG